ncbi:hypothetical protein [Prescottella agglutinans]|uniref:Uncharacterized protein n=1 Tax=Prescottella agglutinans TaxID=1644129 RepID=A0ABT6MF46_9NOCA|nr:hypothetical protein [Prescottella agglutinans]MDH6282892.1 hypothetical protein [Prescottella agglutinans]
MNGAQHYAEAERLLKLADGTDPRDSLIVATAQVHATLAQVAATICVAPKLPQQHAEWRFAIAGVKS